MARRKLPPTSVARAVQAAAKKEIVQNASQEPIRSVCQANREMMKRVSSSARVTKAARLAKTRASQAAVPLLPEESVLQNKETKAVLESAK